MEEIKVGEYGRTNLGEIFIFAWLVDGNNKRYTNKVILGDGQGFTNEFYYFEKGEEIVKHSPNIIDLIEEGDYVNGELVTAIFDLFDENEDVVGKKLTTQYRTAQYTGVDNRYYIYEQDIKSIVTKEQFNQMKYIVGDE